MNRRRRRTSFALLVIACLGAVVLFSWAYTATSWAPGYILSFALGGLTGAGLLYGFLRRGDRDATEAAEGTAEGAEGKGDDAED